MEHLRDALSYAGGRFARFSAIGWLITTIILVIYAVDLGCR